VHHRGGQHLQRPNGSNTEDHQVAQEHRQRHQNSDDQQRKDIASPAARVIIAPTSEPTAPSASDPRHGDNMLPHANASHIVPNPQIANPLGAPSPWDRSPAADPAAVASAAKTASCCRKVLESAHSRPAYAAVLSPANKDSFSSSGRPTTSRPISHNARPPRQQSRARALRAAAWCALKGGGTPASLRRRGVLRRKEAARRGPRRGCRPNISWRSARQRPRSVRHPSTPTLQP
jgi:hypothetical protein